MKEQTLFVDENTFYRLQSLAMEKDISKTKNEENPLKCADKFLDYSGINIWENGSITSKLHFYTKK